MVVQPNERNIADQQTLIEELFTSHSIYTHTLSLKQLKEFARLEGGNEEGKEGGMEEGKGRGKRLVVRLPSGEEKVASVVYYRAGYTPEDYDWEEEISKDGGMEGGKEGGKEKKQGPGWQVREMIERSNAIKCPTLGYQLAGTKRIQQVLSTEGMLEKFLTPRECQFLRKTFAKQYSLGNV